MTLNLSNDLKFAKRQINSYIKKGQIVPKDVLSHYSNLLSVANDRQSFTFGTLTPGSFPTITTSSTSILPTNNNRTYVLIQNIGNNVVFLDFDSPAANNGGLKLSANEKIELTIKQFVTANINAIAIGGSSTLSIFTIVD